MDGPADLSGHALSEAGPSSKQTERASVLWHSYLTGDKSRLDRRTRAVRGIFRHLPSAPRCRVCQAPFAGIGGLAMRTIGFGADRSRLNPTLCGRCDKVVTRYQVGTEVELTLLFADVRGSSDIAERIDPASFHRQINRFFQAATEVLVASDALIEKLIGDEVAGIYVPGICGPDHGFKAVEAARALLVSTGHADPEGPWIRVGAGVHTGTAYVCAVGSPRGVSDITVLGDTANVTARLASLAGAGEILVSEAALGAARMNPGKWEARTLDLKGRREPVPVWVIPVGP